MRRYQQSNNLNQSSRLDRETRNSLGLTGSNTSRGEAACSADQWQSNWNGNYASNENSSGNIS